ncbi:MAG TPA: hypothetical protein VIW03_11835, partial [Anaeromyxobacter sp.]
PLAIEGFWNGARDRFPPEKLFLDGRPWSAEGLFAALEGGPMRRRSALALDLAVRSRGLVQLDPRALARRQLRELPALRALAGRVHAATYREVMRLGAPGARMPGPA